MGRRYRVPFFANLDALFGCHPVADVRDQAKNLGSGVDAKRAEADLNTKAGSVLAATNELTPGAQRRLYRLPHILCPMLSMDLSEARGEQHIDRLVDQLVPGLNGRCQAVWNPD